MVKIEKPSQLLSYLKDRFGIVLPENMELTSSQKHGLRIHNKAVHGTSAWGVTGFLAHSGKEFNSYFIQLIGHFAKKNLIALNSKDTQKYFEGQLISKNVKGEKGDVILIHGGHILGCGSHDGSGKIKPTIKKSRKILNAIKPYPGRNL
ncbi:hypothetical protein HZC08_02075 [Candidatus Micrarchaeota archaeon]|nr:hypothetical protein [Candidatus Micrarchaeota archaeon]